MTKKMMIQNESDFHVPYIQILVMENDHVPCDVCCQTPQTDEKIQLKCQHVFCTKCLREYIKVLKDYKQLTPNKLQCVHEGCSQQIDDATILKVFPGEEGFVLKTIKKCYSQAKNPASVIFSCVGIMKTDRKPIVEKTSMMTREEHSRLVIKLVRDIEEGRRTLENIKSCNNIHIYNKSTLSKEKSLQCYLCGCSYCLNCFQFSHEGSCPIKKDNPMLQLKSNIKGEDNFDRFLDVNQIRRCLNPKCGIPIDKQEGCFWVKCRCSWQMCYPCAKLWGDCEHFSKYPYQKFTPPADWLVKALNLY